MKTLKQFDLLCENILNEKKSTLFTKMFTTQRYIQEDFDQVWEGSGFKKLLVALDNALGKSSTINDTKTNIKMPELNVYKMLDLKSKKYTDLPGGVTGSENTNASLKLTYDIIDEYKYPLLKILLARNQNSDNNMNKFGMFADYINGLVTKYEDDAKSIKNKLFSHNIKTDIKLEIIAIPQAKDNYDYSQNTKHTHLSEKGFDCTIFLWFDVENFKRELKETLNSVSAANPESTLGSDQSQIQSSTGISSKEQAEKDIDNINSNNSKIKLGKENITLLSAEDGTLSKLWSGIKGYDLATPLLKMTGNTLGLNKLFNYSKQKEKTQQPDKIKINKHFWHSIFDLGDLSKPYINVVSKATLQTWLYKDNYLKSADNIGKNTNIMIQLRKPFKEELIKKDKNSPGELIPNLANNMVWTTGQKISSSSWEMTKHMQEFLKPNINDTTKSITCRWQYYVDNSRGMYAEYRVAIQLTAFYKLLNSLDNILLNFKQHIDDLSKNEIFQNNIINNIELLQKNPTLICPNNIVNQNKSNNNYIIFNKFITTITESGIINFLKNSVDNSIGMLAKNGHLSNFQALNSILNKDTFLLRETGVRDVNYIKLNINNLFNDWWTRCYLIQNNTHDKPDKDYDLRSLKHLYTNNGKSPNSDIPRTTRNGFQGFADSDSGSAEYFKNKILNSNSNLNLNGKSLNDFFNTQYIQPKILNNIELLKQYFSAFIKFNKCMNQLYKNTYNDPTIQRAINGEASLYIISKEKI